MVTMIKKLSLLLFFSATIVSAVTWTYTENTTGTNLLALGYPVPIAVNSLSPVAGFRAYDALFARHQDLMISSDQITGTIVGNTTYGRDIWAYSLSDSDNTTHEGLILEAAVLQNGGLHAREWSSPEVVTGLMERLAANENDQGFYQYLLENLNIIIHPVENVDGFLQTQRYPDTVLQSTFVEDPSSWPRDGRMRRKNMRAVDEDLATESDGMLGVDLNRNNAPFWNTSSSSSANNSSLVYHGNAMDSEPETLSLQAAAALGPADRLRFYVDSHSYTQLWFMPTTDNTRRNNIASEIANMMRSATNNTYSVNPVAAGSGIGSTDEYFAYTYQIPAYTLETEPGNTGGVQYGGFGVSHSGFILPEAEISRVREELADASMIAWYMQSGPAALIAVEIRDIDADTIVYAGNWSATSTNSRSWNETVNTGLQSNGNYRLWAAYNKPMRWLDEQQQIINFTALNLDLSPQVSLEGLAADGTAFSQAINGSRTDWLLTAGGAGQGYLNYKTDAFITDFTVNAGIDPASSTLLALAFNNIDITGKLNDASPATVVDWDSNWVNYENSAGTKADDGGIDRTLRLVDDGSTGFTDPATITTGGGTSNPGNNNTGSGGGSFGWLVFLMIVIWSARSRTGLAKQCTIIDQFR